MKRLICLSLLYFAVVLPASATTVNFTSTNLFDVGSFTFVDANGNVLSDGDLVRIGYFENSSAITAGMSVEEMEIAGVWHDFGDLQISSPFDYSGKVYGDVTDTSAAASAFDGKSLYIWVFDAGTTSAASSYGVFQATSAELAWIFPNNQYGLGDSVTLNIDEASLQAVQNVGEVDAASGEVKLVSIEAVPEPSAMALGGLSLLAIGGFRWVRARGLRQEA
ncbi:MAG: PEP-CTERM sorting domain-containing protein [Chthoniobacteraceae bacterium]